MHTQTAIRSEAVRHSVPPPRNALHCRTESLMARSASSRSIKPCILWAPRCHYPRNAEIFGENEPADYRLQGHQRQRAHLQDLERRPPPDRRVLSSWRHLRARISPTSTRFSAEAMTDTKVSWCKRSALDALAGRDAAIAGKLFAVTGRELRRVQDRVLLLIKSAQERVASFLLEMAERACRRATSSSCRCRARISPTTSV